MTMNYPEMVRIRQSIQAPQVVDIEEEMDRQLAAIEIARRVNKGAHIAITAGSRGIANIDQILKCLVDHLKQCGAKPFIIPAMGSHGGATAEGQVKVLESLNITEAFLGAPVRASMEVVEIARSEFGFPVLVDKLAAAADGLVVVNRIKPHTEFEGPIESGLMKMMAIGTGMDTNVIGRIMFIGEKEPEAPQITRIVALDITEGSHGNAVGIGLADYTTRRLVDKIDLAAIATNAITAMTPEKGRIPIALPTDRQAVEAALKTIGAVEPRKARIAHIKNTSEMSQLDVSAAVYKSLETGGDLKLVAKLGTLRFDTQGQLAPVPMP